MKVAAPIILRPHPTPSNHIGLLSKSKPAPLFVAFSNYLRQTTSTTAANHQHHHRWIASRYASGEGQQDGTRKTWTGANHFSSSEEKGSRKEMSIPEKAMELYVGEKGLLLWLNKFAYASIFIMIGLWILFRFVGPALNLYQLDTPPLAPTSVFKGP